MSRKNQFKTHLEKIVKIFFLGKESYLVLRELYKVTLQRIDDNGTVQNITLENNEPKATPCP